MKKWTWAILAGVGFGLMVESYERLLRGDPQAPWAAGFLCIGEGNPARPLEVGTHFSTRLRFLPGSRLAESILENRSATKPENKANLEAQLRPKLIELPIPEMGQLVGWLARGGCRNRGRTRCSPARGASP